MLQIAMKTLQMAIFWSVALLAYQTIKAYLCRSDGEVRLPAKLLITGSFGVTLTGLLTVWRRFWDGYIVWLDPSRDVSLIAKLTGIGALFMFFLIIWWFHAVLRGYAESRAVAWRVEHRQIAIALTVAFVLTVYGK